jgi:hypothetical protein
LHVDTHLCTHCCVDGHNFVERYKSLCKHSRELNSWSPASPDWNLNFWLCSEFSNWIPHLLSSAKDLREINMQPERLLSNNIKVYNHFNLHKF